MKPDAKTRTIVVNAREHETADRDIGYEEVVALAYPGAGGPNITFTVTYRRGQGNKPEGMLVAGQSVRIKDGMIFDVTRTDKS